MRTPPYFKIFIYRDGGTFNFSDVPLYPEHSGGTRIFMPTSALHEGKLVVSFVALAQLSFYWCGGRDRS